MFRSTPYSDRARRISSLRCIPAQQHRWQSWLFGERRPNEEFLPHLTSVGSGVRPRARAEASFLPDANRTTPQILWIVIAAAFAGALGETAVRYATRVVLGRPTFLNPNSVWLGPLLNLAVLAIPTALIFILSRSETREKHLAFLAAFFVTLEVLLLMPGLAFWAILLLAVGMAAEAGALVTKDLDLSWRRARALSIVMLICSAGLGLRDAQLSRDSGARHRAALDAPRTGTPNVLLVVLDAVRAPSMGLYGGPPATTPFLSKLATRCVNYRKAIAPASWTLPSHASMFTGQWPRDLTADWTIPLDRRFPTVAELLAQRGYATGAAVGNYLYTYYEFGLSRGFAHYDDYGISPSEAGLRSVVGDHLIRIWNQVAHDYVVPGRKDATRISHDIFEWMDGQRTSGSQRPFFVFLNWYDAHDPYAPPNPWRRAFLRSEPPTRDIAGVESRLNTTEVDGLRNAYHGSVAYLDSELDSLVTGLEQRGVLDNTLLIITSDHGEEFAEHGRLQHGATLYYSALHVPLLICPPAADSLGGRVVDTPVSLRDLGHTMIAATTGIEHSDNVPGYDLLRLARPSQPGEMQACRSAAISYLRRPPRTPKWYPGSRRTLSSIVDDRYHFIRTDGGTEELFDVVADPWEQRNLIDDAGADSIATRMRRDLEFPLVCVSGSS